MKQGLHVDVAWDGRAVNRVNVSLNRMAASTLLVGRKVDEAVGLLPRLYSLCGRAQGIAARLATDAAKQRPHRLDAATARELLIEQVQEHLWRLLRDWPPLYGIPARNAEMATWYRRLGAADAATGRDLADYVEKSLLGTTIQKWLDIADEHQLVSWACGAPGLAPQLVRAVLHRPAEAGAVRCLDPGLCADDFGAPWPADFARAPLWRGAPAETGAYARWRAHPLVQLGGNGLLARVLARLMDLATNVRQLSNAAPALADASSVADNVGVARVETARGVLLHRVTIDDDRVADYVVVAPTEWNFHRRGGFVSAAARCVGDNAESVRQEISRWVVAYDPCVDWNVELQRA